MSRRNLSGKEDYRRTSTFSDEENIINIFRIMCPRVYKFCPDNKSPFVKRLNNTIVNEARWSQWVNNSGNTNKPPDYYNDREKLMMEVMRVDHYMFMDKKGKPHNKNAENIAKVVKELINDGKESFLENNLIIGAVETEDHESEYNYKQYLESFKRVLKHHIDMIPNYRANYPGYKLIFMIFDESSSYGIARDQSELSNGHFKPKMFDDHVYHFPCMDEKFFSVIRDIDVDQIIWLAPFKSITTNVGPMPDCQLMIIDPHIEIETIEYDPEQVICLESPGGNKDMPFSLVYKGMRIFFFPKDPKSLLEGDYYPQWCDNGQL